MLRYATYTAGLAASAPVLSAFFTSCKSDPEITDTAYAPQFFTAAEYAFVTKFADTMLPADDTPGAVDVGVPQMMDKMNSDVYSEKAQAKTRKELAALMAGLQQEGKEAFVDMDAEAALQLLQEKDQYFKTFQKMAAEKGEEPSKEEVALSAAFFSLKSAIVSTFVNTEEVGTTMMAYDPVPGEYIPCGDLQELSGGKVWSVRR